VPKYGEMPDAAREALNRSSAEFAAGRLSERAQHAHQVAARAAGPRPLADQGAGQPGEPAVDQAIAVAADSPAAAAGPVMVRWAWPPIAAMALPLLLLLLVVLV